MSAKVLLVCSGCDGIFLRDLSWQGARHLLGFDSDSDTDSVCGTLEQIPADLQLKLFGRSRIVERVESGAAPQGETE